MDMETYQDLAADEPNEIPEASFATISEIFEDGVTLLFDGLDAPTTKRYKVNTFVVFQANDRVRVIKDSGTYVVEYPVGNPRTEFTADSATNADHATTADTATSATSAVQAQNADYATRAGTANSATSASSANTANTASTCTRATVALNVGSNRGTSTYIRFMVNSNGYFVSSTYNGTWRQFA